MHSFPIFFGITTIELIQGVGFCTGAMMSCCTRSSSVSWRTSLNGTGTRLGECCTGHTISSSLIRYLPSRRPTPGLNTSGCFFLRCSVDTGPGLTSVKMGASPVRGRFSLLFVVHVGDNLMPMQAFLHNRGRTPGPSTSLQSSRHPKSPRHTQRSTNPTTGSVAPP